MLPSKTSVDQDAGGALQSSSQPRWTLVSAVTLGLLAAAATWLRFLSLPRKPFWFDECFSVEIAKMSWHDFLRLLWWREANMSLYYLLLRGWLLVGSVMAGRAGPVFIRSLSVLISLAGLAAISWLGSKLFDRRVGLIACALMSCNAYHIRYAQEARSYSLFMLLATLSSGFFVAYLQDSSRRNRTGYVLTSVLAVYSHLYALLLLAAQWLSVRGVEKTSETRVTSAALRRAWITIGIAVLPLLVFVAKTGAGPIRWIWRPKPHDVLDFFEHLAGNDGLPLLLVYVAACLAAVLPLRARLFRRGANWDVWRCQFLLIWILFPVGLTLAISLARPVFLGRYFSFCLPALILLAAAGLSSLRKGWMLGACLAAMMLLSLRGTISYYDHDFDLARDGSEAATNYILDHTQTGDAILFHIAEARIPFEFFSSVRGAGGGAAVPEIIFPRHGEKLDYRDVTGKPTPALLRSVSSRYPRLWVVLMSNGSAEHSDATTGMLSQVLGDAFPRMQRVQFPQVEVRLYSEPSEP